MSRRIKVRNRWYWFRLGVRHGFIEFGRRRLVWHIFTTENDPPSVTVDGVPLATGGRR